MNNNDCQRLFVIMDALNQVRRGRRTEKLLSHSHDFTSGSAVSFSKTERFGYIYLLHFFNNDAIVFGRNFSSRSSHLRFHDDSSMSATSLLGRSFPYISMICWNASLFSSTLVITVGIKNKSPEAE